MKIDQSTILRKGFSTELSQECAEFIANLKRTGPMEEFISKLDSMTEWSSVLGKTEMGRWTDILNDCDEILEAASKSDDTGTLAIDADEKLHHPVISIMRFTSLLFENSFSRSVYSSMERLLRLLDSRNMLIVVQVLRLLHIISKSSRYITQHVQHTEKRVLYMKLTANIECWGGKLRNVKMSDFCVENPENWDLSAISFRTNSGVENFPVDLYTTFETSKQELQKKLNDSAYEVEESEKILAIAKLKLAYNLVDNTSRYFCIMSRLISISALFYSRCLLDEWRINCLINDDLIEQICALLQLPMGSIYNPGLDGVKTEAMKTITSIVFLDKPRKIHLVVDCLGLNSYHGYTATLVRTCVDRLKSGSISEANSEFSVNFVTALFSMVYHIAGIDYGGESLISCSMIGALLEVMKSCSFPDSQISFVTRAVRIIDLLTGFDVTEFNSNDGMTAIVERFCHEVEVCKQHMSSNAIDTNGSAVCHQQRVALMKSLLNFLKRAVVDTNYATQVRRIMEGDLPTAITHIVENPQYYGSSLLHCAIHLTTSFIYQEPTQLTFLQDKGLTDALLKSLFNEKFPLSRDLVTGLPSICSALCLNERGLKAFNEHSPLERIFRIIFSTRFVSSLRKRKNELLEVATGLGTAFDELLRHQPTLRKDLIHAFVKVLDDILAYGSNADGKKCVVSWNIGKTGPVDDDHARRSESTPRDQETGDEEYVEPNRHRGQGVTFAQPVDQCSFQLCFEQDGGSVLPLGDYAGIIGSLLEAVLTNRAAQENSLLILECGVPQKLVKILTFGKPYPAIQQSSYLQNLANIIRHLLSQSNKVDAFDVLVSSVSDQLESYERCKCPEDAVSRERMYLLTRMSSLVFVVSNFMKTSLSNVHDTRSLLLNYFAGNETGQAFIRRLFSVYRDLNWDMLFLNSQQQQQQASNQPLASLTENLPSDGTTANTQSPAPITAHETSAASPMDTGTSETGTSKSTKKGGEHSLERSVHSMVSRSLKQVSEVIIWLGKTFCNSITRLRRGFDSSAVRDSHKVAEMLFSGVVQLFQLNDDMAANWSGMYIYQVLSILKKMVFDEYQGHLIMLPFFYKSGCHKAFFDQGEFLVANANKEEFGVAIAIWLSIVQRLVCANSILSKNRNETRSQVEGFDAKKYLSMCQKDALKSLGNFFKATIASRKEALRDEDCKLLDKIIATIQVLVRGVVYVHDLDKKNNTEPEFDVLINEIDTDKVQQLVEMGFSQSDAVDALLQHTSVPEAAEFLLSMQNAPSGSGASLRRSGGYVSARSSRRITTEAQPAIPATPGTDDRSAGTNQENATQVQQTTGEGEEPPVVALQEALQSLEPIDAETSPLQNAANEPSSAPTLEQGASATTQPEQEGQVQGDEKMDTDEQVPSTSTGPSDTLKKTEASEPTESFSFRDLKATKPADFKDTINYICNEIVPDCLQLVEKDQMLMFSVAELLAVFVNDPIAKDWAQNVLVKQCLIAELEQLIDKFSAKPQPTEQDELVNRFASLLHMFCLLWQGFDNIKVYSLLQPNFYDKTAGILFSLIEEQHNLSSKLIPPVLLCLDMYEKEKRVDMRQQLLSKSVEHIQWSYWINDERYGTTDWRDYPPVCSAVLNRAFREGRSSVQLVVNDKNVVVDFVDMTQRLAEPSNVGAHSVSVFGRAKLKPDFDIEELFRSETHLNEGSDQQRRIIRCLLELLKSSDPPISVALAYSSLSLLLRFVSLKGMAKTFVEAQGVETLIRLECRENMALIPTAVALILRACIDDDATLENAFEWMIRSVEAGLPVSLSDMSSRMMPYNRPRRHHKEWRRAMRLFAPMAARAPLLYTNIMKKNVEFNNNELTLKTEQNPQEAPKSICSEESVKVLKSIVTNLVHELQSTDFSATKHRVLRPAALLKLLSEILRSYSSAAVILVDMALENRSVVSMIIEKFLLNASDQPDVAIASKAVLTNLIVCPLTTKATELLVNEVKTLLQRTLVHHNSDRSNKLCEKVSILARLVMLLRESVKVAVTNRLKDAKQPSQFMRYIHKKNLAVDFAKSIWLLPLQEKSANETITQILRMFENIARDLTTVIRTTTAPATAPVATANAPSTTETDVTMAPVGGEDSAAPSEQQPAGGSSEQNVVPPVAATDHPEQGGSQATENRPALEESNASMVDLSLAHDATAEFEHGVGHFEHAGGLDHIGPNMALYHAELIEDDSQDDGSDSSDSSSSDESGSAGSDGEGGGEMLDDEETSEGEGGDHQNAMEGIRRRQFHRQIDAQVRTSTPISDDEHDDHVDEDEGDHAGGVLGDPIMDDTQGEEDDDDDEEMNEEEALEDGDEDDVIEEFEDVLTEYLDATDLADRGNEIRAVGDELRRIEVRMQAAAFHPPPPAHHHQHLATRGGWLNELELLAAASAGYVAGIFGGGGVHAPGGVPDTRFGPGRMLTTGFPIGLDTNRDAAEPLTHHPMLRRPHTTRLEAVNNILANANNTATGGGPGGMPALLGDQPNIGEFLNHDTAMQRIMIHRLANSRRAQGLRRQGALRRWYPIGGTQHTTGRATHRLLSRIIDESFFPEVNVNMYRPYDDGHTHSQETSAEQRLADAFVPYFLDRLGEQARMLDAQSAHYVNILLAAVLTTQLRPPTPEPAPSTAPAPIESETTPAEQDTVQERTEGTTDVEMVSAGEPEPLVNTEQNPSTEHQQELEAMPESNEPSRQATEETAMQVTPEPVVSEDVSMQELPPTAQPVAEEVPIQPTAEENTTQEGSSSAAPTVPSAPGGSDELPEGMDPEFLAALPEDIRQEVIRDHHRQQRAQRLNQQAAASSSSGASEGQQEGVNAAVEEEEVLDQEFLAALPPELQEEVLAQHEQRIAQRNRAAQANANADALAAAGADVEGVFESLPPTLRQQVLADIDESMLQVLPPNLLEEANRARANFEQQQAFRFSRILDHRSVHRGMEGGGRAGQPLGPGASTVTTEEHGVQIFDRESVVTMLMLYFLDHEKFSLQRLQKLLKPLCLHSGTCDYIIWCLLSILDSLNTDMGEDETTVSNEGWIDGFQIQSALNQPEKALRLTADSVKVHPLIKSNVCLRILETLVFLARNFPQHFLPNKIRSQSTSKRFDSIPDIRAFWDIVRSINKKTNAEENKPSSRALTQMRDIIPPLLEQSPVAFLLQYTNSTLVKSNAPLMDKSMKILQTVAQSIPSNCESINESSISWLNTWLQEFSKLILDTCLEEGLKDGRMFLNEILRIMPNQRPNLFKMLYDNVKEQGLHLQEDIKTLLDELAQLKIKKLALASDINSTESQIIQKPTTSTEALATSVGETGAKDGDALPLSTLKAFTSRNSQSRKFLKSLETISFLRNQLKIAERRRQAARTQQQQPATSQAIPTAQQQQPEGEGQAAQEQPTGEQPTTSGVAVTPETTATAETSPKEISNAKEEEKNLQDMLDCLEPLWKLLSTCLDEMSQLLDSHAVLSLQHAAEAFFLAHAFSITTNKDKGEAPVPTSGGAEQQPLLPSSPSVVSGLGAVGSHLDMNKYSKNMFAFAEKHRTVLNQILRSNTNNLMEESAFAILTHFPKLLDFDVKRKYFYKEIRKLDDRSRHEDVAVRIRRAHLFSDSFRELYRLRNSDWKARFYIIFEGEEGQDAGGLLREWYSIITREVFNPNYALFITAPGDRVTYMINKSSNINPEHLDYFKFVGRVIAKAIYDNKQLDCYFTRAFYKHILNVSVKYQDIESEDPSYFKSLEFLLNNPIEDLGADLTFSVEVEEFGVRSMRQLKEDGTKVPVTDTNKEEYVQMVCQMKMTGSIRKQLDAFLEGFYQIIPRQLISIFDEQELELLISGLPEIDIDDLCNNTEYKTYTRSSPQIQWFWRALRSFEQEDLAKFLQFVTGTSKVPLQGFSQLEGMNGVQKFTIHMDSRSSERLPSAHTCFNQLDLPQYESYEQLRKMFLLAIREGSEGFAFA